MIIISKIVLFLLWANFLPPLASLLLGERFSYPLDGGRIWRDGNPFFGPHKTIRGVIACLLGCIATAPLFRMAWWIAGAGALLAITGDLITSFIKRRFNLPSGTVVVGLDQFLEGALPALFLSEYYGLHWWRALSVLLLFIPTTYLGSVLWAYLMYQPSEKDLPRIIRSSSRLKEWRASHDPLARWQVLINFENVISHHLLMGLTFKALGLYEKGLQNALDIKLREETFWFPGLPEAFDGFRILLLTDLHLDGMPGLTEKIIEQVKLLSVDLCLVGGDFRMETYGPIAPSLRHLRRLLPHIQAEQGILGVLGNHDCIEMAPDLEEAGMIMLINDAWPIEKKGHCIWIVGIDDPHYYRVHDLWKAFRDVPAEGFKIFLAHSPEAYNEATGFHPELYLCGHTHGGQIKLPNKGPIFTNSRAPRFTVAGRWNYKGMDGYTSTGAGASGIPLRFNCPGEITLLTLRRGLREGED